MRQLFLDLDGVFADFNKGVKAITGKEPSSLPSWKLWSSINKKEDFRDYEKSIKKNHLTFFASADLFWSFRFSSKSKNPRKSNWSESYKQKQFDHIKMEQSFQCKGLHGLSY